MLGTSSHHWKVNFCKFTNETRNGMEDSSRNDGLRFVAAVNGACAGGGYEIALACDEILMVDDRSTAVSLPEVPAAGRTAGYRRLTRLIDKRKVRRDVADLFCTNADGVRAERAKAWKLVDEIATPSEFAALVRDRAAAHVAVSSRVADARVSRCVRSHAPSTPAAITTPRRRRIRPRRAQRDDRRARPARAAAAGRRRNRRRR